MSKSKIEWCDEVWNPMTGCSKCSPGCENCYAEPMAKRLQKIPSTKEKYKNGFGVTCHEDELSRKFSGKGKRIFVCSMGDLFHEDVPFEFIERVIQRIRRKPQHTFMILTKRAERMVKFFRTYHYDKYNMDNNLWVGVTVENQEMANKRIPLLLQIPAVKRFVSVEPMLGKVDLTRINGLIGVGLSSINALIGREYHWDDGCVWTSEARIDWVICGGESGHRARPMHPDWVRGLRDQCKHAGVPFFFKQWGEWLSNAECGLLNVDLTKYTNDYIMTSEGKMLGAGCKWGGMVEPDWADQGGVWFHQVGKKKAGCLLDGVEVKEVPSNEK